MKLNISSASEEPIYEQIKNQIRSAIVSGELQVGDALPSLRKLAGELHISVLTVTRAYNDLADEGLVKNIQGKGAFVMEHGNELIRERASERIMDKFREASIEAKASGISLLDLLGMFEKAYREQS
ncbi:GntR family transcriptional regulator [Bifidobacterium ruminantium]|uniref:Transcriptional regulator, GntR family n=1 Tax=Bifidobacterium ruminantium TaxID=78346 RepID=A0A087D2V0_BIFRU|nr:GntR family transcriptional regulator [Bifidobacterium ruminantium]KFI89850.1 transcriptional regulator, GntR family [Bifidobacterium ruminantium]